MGRVLRVSSLLPVEALEAIDDWHALRGRLIERARAGEAGTAGLEAEVRALVEREAARCRRPSATLCARGCCCSPPGSARSSRCCPTRRSTR